MIFWIVTGENSFHLLAASISAITQNLKSDIIATYFQIERLFSEREKTKGTILIEVIDLITKTNKNNGTSKEEDADKDSVVDTFNNPFEALYCDALFDDPHKSTGELDFKDAQHQ